MAAVTQPILTVEEMRAAALESRREILKMIFDAGSGHTGGSLSEIDILIALYFGVLRYDPGAPDWPETGPVRPEQGTRLAGFLRNPGSGRLFRRR